MSERHFTAWVTSDRSAVANGRVDVVVLKDERDNTGSGWTSVGDPIFSADTTMEVGGDFEEALRQAEELLNDAGWHVASEWCSISTGAIATVSSF